MPLTIEQKREILQQITRLAGKLQDIEFDLRLRGEEDLAEMVRDALTDLFERIDRLRGQIADE